MESVIKVGTVWKYTGLNPAIIQGEHGPISPLMEILEINGRGEIKVGYTNRGPRSSYYTMLKFLNFFTVFKGHDYERTTSFRALAGTALFKGISKEEIQDLLVKLEI